MVGSRRFKLWSIPVRMQLAGSAAVVGLLALAAFEPTSAQVPPPEEAVDTLFPHAPPHAVGLSAERISDLAALLDRWARDTLIVGGEVLIVKDGRTVFHEAVGWSDLEAREPMRKNSIFRLLAMTKPFTGTAALMLVQDGRIDLDVPVHRWLPSWANQRSGAVTVRQLLTHTSGWEQYGTPLPLESYSTLRAMVDAAGRQGPQHPPARAYRYSDVNSYALGALVSEAAGISIEDFIEERILDPLDLHDTHTRFSPDTVSADRVNSRYNLDDGTWEKVWSPDRPEADRFFRASGGLFTTVTDYARWLQIWTRWAYRVSDGTVLEEDDGAAAENAEVLRLLSEGMAREALTPHSGPYGYHWEILSDDPLIFGHGGVDGTHAMAIPSRNVIVVYLTQSQNQTVRGQWIRAALHAVAPDLELNRPLASIPAARAALDVLELNPLERERYTGRYGSDRFSVRIFEEDGWLRRCLPSAGRPRVTLVPLGSHMFALGRYNEGELAQVVLPLQRLRFVVENRRATALELIRDGEVRVVLSRVETEGGDAGAGGPACTPAGNAS